MRSSAQPLPSTPDHLSPSRRVVWDAIEATMRERWEHTHLPDLEPKEVERAMLAPTTPMIGARETLARMMGPPLERHDVGFGSTVDPGAALVRPNRDEPEPGEKIDHGDGTWSRRRLDGVAEGQLRWMGPVLYRFEGQIRYSSSTQKRNRWRWTEPSKGRDDLSARGQILGSTRTDSLGGTWRAVDVDEQAVARMVVAYDRAMALATGEEEEPEEAQFEDYEDEGGWSRPLGRWTKQVCGTDATTGEEDHCLLLDGEDNREWISLSEPPTERQKATAMLALDNVGEGVAAHYKPSCGGVFLSPWTILTAAHCVTDLDSDTPRDSVDIRVCSTGNTYPSLSACSKISGTISLPAEYDGSGPKRDYAIIHANSTADVFHDSHNKMFMTRARDSYVTDYRMYNVASPSFYSPSNPCADNEGLSTSDVVKTGAQMVFSRGEIKSRTGYFKLFFSSCSSHSGSPVYYCGDYRCDTGEYGKVVSLQATAAGTRKGVRGPKVRKFRTWALVQIIF